MVNLLDIVPLHNVFYLNFKADLKALGISKTMLLVTPRVNVRVYNVCILLQPPYTKQVTSILLFETSTFTESERGCRHSSSTLFQSKKNKDDLDYISNDLYSICVQLQINRKPNILCDSERVEKGLIL